MGMIYIRAIGKRFKEGYASQLYLSNTKDTRTIPCQNLFIN